LGKTKGLGGLEGGKGGGWLLGRGGEVKTGRLGLRKKGVTIREEDKKGEKKGVCEGKEQRLNFQGCEERVRATGEEKEKKESPQTPKAQWQKEKREGVTNLVPWGNGKRRGAHRGKRMRS